MRVQKPPQNWGPLVSKKLQFGTDVALFSKDQWGDIGENFYKPYFIINDLLQAGAIHQKVDVDKARSQKNKDDLQMKSKESTEGWSNTKEHKKK